MKLKAPKTREEAKAFVEGQLPPYDKALRFELSLLAGSAVQVRPVPLAAPADRRKALGTACSDDPLRPAFTGIFEDATNNALVATDGHLLVVLPEPGLGERLVTSRIVDPESGKVINERFVDWTIVIYDKALRAAQYPGVGRPGKKYADAVVTDIGAFAAQLNGIVQAERFRANKVSWIDSLLVLTDGKKREEVRSYFRAPLLLRAVQVLRADGARRLHLLCSSETPNLGLVLADADEPKRLAMVMPLAQKSESFPSMRLELAGAAVPTVAQPRPEGQRPALSPAQALQRLLGRQGWLNNYRARYSDDKGKNTPLSLLTSYGYVQPKDLPDFLDSLRDAEQVYTQRRPTTPELLSWDTWFWLYPEKVAGREEVTTSMQFPITIVGTREDVERTIRAGMARAKGPTEDRERMKKKLALRARAALALKRKGGTLSGVRQLPLSFEETATGATFSGFAGLGGVLGGIGLSGLGELTASTRANIAQNKLAVDAVLAAAEQDRQVRQGDTLDFDTVVKLYNPGVTDDEIRAWVWYQREIGNPMEGWDSYYIRGQQLYRGVALSAEQVRKHRTRDDRADWSELMKLFRKGVLYYLDGALVPYPVYAFGNMYDRELMLREDEARIRELGGDEVVARHRAVIQQCRPKPLSVMTTAATERPRILAISEVSRTFTVKGLREEANVVWPGSEGDSVGEQELPLDQAFKLWLRQRPSHEFDNTTAYEQIKYYLENAPKRNLEEAQKQTVEMFAGPECEAFFARFLHEALLFDDQQKLDFAWNRTYNGQSAVPYLRVPVGFRCSATFKSGPLRFTPAQREAISFMECSGSGILAYDVGVGKTMSAIITCANAMFSGRVKRPLLVVPNPTYAKWIGEIVGYTNSKGQFVPGVLSYTGIKVNEWYNLGTDIRAKLERGKKPYHVAENTITVVTYEGLEKIGFGKGVSDSLVTELLDILEQTPKEGSKAKSARDAEKEFQKLRELVSVGRAGTVADIDAIGFDCLVVDEAHNFKKVFASVPLDEEGNKRFNLNAGEPSARGIRLFLLANYVQRTFGTRALVLLLTATPFTNSPLEIYSMLSLVGLDQLKAMGLYNLVAFMETFVQVTAEWVNSYDGTVKFQQVVKGYNNRLVLQKLIFNKIAYKTGEDAGVRRPCKINLPRVNVTRPKGEKVRLAPEEQTLTYLPMTARQQNNQNEINSRLRNAKGGPEGAAELMRALADSLNNALMPHLYDGGTPETPEELVESSPKLRYICGCIASVKAWHEQRGESVSGQVVYLNRGKDYFPLIKRYLEEQVGFKSYVTHQGKRFSEVEIIISGISGERKEAIKDAFLAGVVKVIIGTQTIREGIDLQTYGTVIYNGYPDWNPTDVKQLEGRIWRQGNTYAYVRSVLPLLQNSMDVFVAQKLEEKQARVNDVFYRADTGNMLAIEDIDPEEIKFAIFTDETQLVKLLADKDFKDAKRRAGSIEAELKALAGLEKQRETYKRQHEAAWQRLRDRYVLLGKHLTPERYTRWDPVRYRSEGDVTPPVGYNAQYGAGWSADRKASFHERVKDTLDRLAPVLEAGTADDRELLEVGRAVERVAETILGYVDSTFSDFKEAFTMLTKTVKSVLAPRGLALDADVAALMQELSLNLKKVQQEVRIYEMKGEVITGNEDPDEAARKQYVNDQVTAYSDRLVKEVRERKQRLKITPGTVEERVESFAALNYLMSYKDADKPDTCDLPGQPCCPPTRTYQNAQAQDSADRERLKRKLALRARAALALKKKGQ